MWRDRHGKEALFHNLLLRILLRELNQLSEWMTVVQFSECASFFTITSRQARPASHNQDWSDTTDQA
jgi:hypothetical protein